MNKILILLLIVGYGVAGTDDYNYRCDQARKANKHDNGDMIINGECFKKEYRIVLSLS